MNVIERAQAPTPKFFRTLRTIGLVLLAIGSGILAAAVELPDWIINFGSYMSVLGGVLMAVSQVTVDEAHMKKKKAAKVVKISSKEKE